MPTPMTVEGADKLREELAHLKKVVRPTIVRAIAEAREHGDLRRGTREYHAPPRISRVLPKHASGSLRHGSAMPRSSTSRRFPATGNVVFGATVTLVDLETDGRSPLQDRRRGRGGPKGKQDLDHVAPGPGHDRQGRRRHVGCGNASRHAGIRGRHGSAHLIRRPAGAGT